MTIYKKYKYEIEWEIPNENLQRFNWVTGSAEFCKEVVSEFDAVTYAIDWMRTHAIDSSNLLYCRVEEVIDSELRTNVLLWIGE